MSQDTYTCQLILRAERAETALMDLLNQIQKTNPIDDHGHDLKMNMAYIKAAELMKERES